MDALVAIEARPLIGVVLALGTAFGGAAMFFPALQWGRHARLLALSVLAVPILLAPLWIPPSLPIARVTAAIFAGLMLFKASDVHVGAQFGAVPDFRTYLRWLPNLFALVQRKPHHEPPSARGEDIRRLLRAATVLAFGFVGVAVARMVNWDGYSFAAEHTVKAVVIFMLFTAGFAFIIRLFGWPAYSRETSPTRSGWLVRPRISGTDTTAISVSFCWRMSSSPCGESGPVRSRCLSPSVFRRSSMSTFSASPSVGSRVIRLPSFWSRAPPWQ
jgi:hypothetical protein